MFESFSKQKKYCKKNSSRLFGVILLILHFKLAAIHMPNNVLILMLNTKKNLLKLICSFSLTWNEVLKLLKVEIESVSLIVCSSSDAGDK